MEEVLSFRKMANNELQEETLLFTYISELCHSTRFQTNCGREQTVN